MKILLIYPSFSFNHCHGINQGLTYISAVLKQSGYHVNGYILDNENDKKFFDMIQKEQPNIIGVSATTQQFYYFKNVLRKIKDLLPNSFIVIGGVHPTLAPDCINTFPEIDAIVRGEGEFPMLELAQALESGNDFLHIQNFWFRHGNKIIKNTLRPVITDLDALPLPEKDFVNLQQIINDMNGVNNFVFSRGCPFDCSFCCNKALRDLQGVNYVRHLSPQRSIQLIKSDLMKYQFHTVNIDDDTLSMNKKWCREFFTLYQEQIDMPFICNVRADAVDEDFVQLLKKAGLKILRIGLEHGNEEFRKKILNKKITNAQLMNASQICKNFGVKCGFFVMLGLPYETRKLFLDTIKLCRKLSVQPHNFAFIFAPYPGTKLYEICKQNNWLPSKTLYHERTEAVIDFPQFRKWEIQLCRNMFTLLMKYKFLPLIYPFDIFVLLGLSCISDFNQFLGILGLWTQTHFTRVYKRIKHIQHSISKA